MKHIIKTGPPREYADWCKLVKGKENEDYRNVHSNERTPLKKSLIKEQGSLCAYTLKRIDLETCHVEHLKPESKCRKDEKGSDLYYDNMVACFPKEDLKHRYRYGAKQKDKWWDEEKFISPLTTRCESLLSFDIKGNIIAVNNNTDAIITIDKLLLNHPTLVEERKRSITEFIYGRDGISLLTKAQAERAISEITKKDKKGNFVEFCVPIRCALLQYIMMLEKQAKRRKYANQSKNKK